MLEILIIVCLAIVLFLSLRNFSRTSDQVTIQGETVGAFWNNVFKKREQVLDEIKAEISRGQEDVVSPGEIDVAQKRFMESDPELARILFEADQALGKEDLREAEELALEAVKKDTRCAPAYVIIGKIAQLRGAFADASEAYKMAVKCNPEVAEAYFGLGQIELRQENFTEAIENLQRAVILDRGQAEWHALLGKAYMQVRQFAKAAKSLKRATNLDMSNNEFRELASEAEDKQRSHSQAFRSK